MLQVVDRNLVIVSIESYMDRKELQVEHALCITTNHS